MLTSDPRFAPERQAAILALLARDGRVVSTVLARELGVSIDTSGATSTSSRPPGLLKRVHGGAVRPLPGEPRFFDRLEEEGPAKERYRGAGRAADRRRGGRRARRRDDDAAARPRAQAGPAATVVTASLDVAQALRGHAGIAVDVLGGRLDRESQTLTGVATVEQLRRLRPGRLRGQPVRARCRRRADAARRARRPRSSPRWSSARGEPIVLAGAAKLGTAGPYIVAPAERVDVLVTDAPEERLRAVPRARASRS